MSLRKLMATVLFTLLCMAVVTMVQAQEVRQKLSQESTLEQVLERGVLRVGFATFVPWAMKDKTGTFTGFEIEVARRLAKDMGVSVEFVPTKWSGIIPALLTGKFDIIVGGMGILPERNLKVNFSRPYEYSGMSIMAHKEVAAGLDSLADFDAPGVTIVARIGTTAADAVKKFMPRADLRLFDGEAQAIQELLNGRAHAMVASAPLPAFTVTDNPDKLFLPLKETFTREPIGFAVRKGDPDFLNFLDNWILVVDSQGWLKERYAYWFTTKEWESEIR